MYFQQPILRQFGAEAGISLCSHANLGSSGRRGTCNEIGTEIPELLDDPVVQPGTSNHKVQPANVLLCYWVQLGIVVLPKSVIPSRIVENNKESYRNRDEGAGQHGPERGRKDVPLPKDKRDGTTSRVPSSSRKITCN